MLACMECTPVAIRSIHILSNMGGGGGATGGRHYFLGGDRHLSPPLSAATDAD
jgi:hypothetical protein